MPNHELTEREVAVLEAVIQAYVDNAEPAGSRTIAKRFGLGISAATIRNTMSDLEDRGYLYHPHTSAGRIPTDRAYRFYVDGLMGASRISSAEENRIKRELRTHTAIDSILDRAAEVLGILTQELGVAAIPSFDLVVLEQLELIQVSSERLLMVLVLKGAAARTIFVELNNELPREAVDTVASVLNEKLAGLTLAEIKRSVRDRLRETRGGGGGAGGERELLNIFVEEADQLFTVDPPEQVVLGSAQLLAEQPEFSSKEKMKELLQLTERKDVLREALRQRKMAGVSVTIGAEHISPQLTDFTIVTSTYTRGELTGVLGVMGPTRMPYRKVLALVEYTSRLVDGLLDEA